MKKTIIAMAALTLALALTGCSGSDSTNTDSAAETTTVSATETDTTAVTEDTTTEAVTEDTTAAVTEAVTEAETAETAAESAETTAESAETTAAENGTQAAPAVDEAALVDQTMKLLEEYVNIEYIAGCGLHVDTEVQYQPEGSTMMYSPVVDERFHSIDDLKKFVSASLSGSLKDELETIMFGDKNPVFIEHEGKLYEANGGRGFDYNFQKDTVKISDVTEKGYKATLKNKGFGDILEDIALTVDCIDGKYYLSSYKLV